MCGIIGVIGESAAQVELQDSLRSLSLRGPDRQASLVSGKAHLGHTRLSIIDTSTGGDQPMQDPTGRYTLVFNGEIYNYRSIASELEKAGVFLTSHSDTEVLLHALIQHDTDALSMLNGFFAFAFYDAQENRLLIARDRMGIKPLYYLVQGDNFYFGSELKALHPLLFEPHIDATALHLYLQFNYIPAPLSIDEEISQLMPGEYLTYHDSKQDINSYYNQRSNRPTRDNLNLRALLTDSVRLRMTADVPLGSFLSGGVDSSIIAALAVQENSALKTFSIGFKDNAHFDESAYAERVAEHIGSDHTTIQLHNDEMLQHVDELLSSLQEPFADSSAIAVHALSHHTRKEVTVALSGDGADELFGGYNKHQAHLIAAYPDVKARTAQLLAPLFKSFNGSHTSKWGNRMRKLQRFSKGLNLPYTKRYWTWASWTQPEELSRLLTISKDEEQYDKLLQSLGPQNETLEEVLRADCRMVLPNDMLRKVDRMSMCNSLEVRVPFLDHRIVDYAHSLPAKSRFSKGRGKYILQEHFADLLPVDIFTRSKKGFEVPLEDWFKGPLQSRVETALSDGVLASTQYFDANTLKILRKNLNQNKIGDKVHLLWALLVLHSYLVHQ